MSETEMKTADLVLAEAAVNAAVKMLDDAPVYSGSICIPSTEVLRWMLTHAKALNNATGAA